MKEITGRLERSIDLRDFVQIPMERGEDGTFRQSGQPQIVVPISISYERPPGSAPRFLEAAILRATKKASEVIAKRIDEEMTRSFEKVK